MTQILTQLNLTGPEVQEFILSVALNWGTIIVRVLLIAFLTRLALRFGCAFILRVFTPPADRPSLLSEHKAKTLIPLLTSIYRYSIYTLAVVLILSEIGMEIGPILAGAGILGLAVGFGAQSLVKDVISGFFIILEDQFSVGDYIQTGEFSGIVEELGMRITKIRDFSGELHILPNGSINAVSNRTRGNMRAMIDVGISYEDDIDQTLAVLEELMRTYAENDADVVEGPTVLGVVALADSSVNIRIIAQTVPMTQWKVERDMLRVIKNKFDELGIEIPYPRRVIFDRGSDKEAGING
ncbi:MAG: mechanosensitive ion channel family protein [Bacillota bacterium]|nr:mechanosensitive ion channel family protein [Bacillota bacterium]MDW7684277.1 mechanosensitive ion channel family protein [Bacillota bacterium]